MHFISIKLRETMNDQRIAKQSEREKEKEEEEEEEEEKSIRSLFSFSMNERLSSLTNFLNVRAPFQRTGHNQRREWGGRTKSMQ